MGHDKWHQGFYSKLKRNDGQGSCCNLMDCRPTQSRMVGDHYEVKVDGAWTPVPHDKINNVVAPDGGAHVCAPRQVESTRALYSASFFPRKADGSTREAGHPLGWSEGNNVQFDYRTGAGNANDIRKYAAELIALADVILANGSQAVRVLLQATRTVPIVFAMFPIRSVPASSKPGAAGRQRHRLHPFEYGLSGEMAGAAQGDCTRVTRVAVLRDPAMPAGRPVGGAPGGGALARGRA